jgi:hypothetical protein
MLGAAASLALPVEITSSEPTRIGMSTVTACSAALDRLYELDERHGGSTIFALATQMVTDLRTTLTRASYSTQVGRELRCVAAATAEHAGWLAYDAGRINDARHWWLEAMHFADLADDPNTRVTALVSMALQACTANDPLAGREAVDLMDLAKRSAGAALTPRLTSLISARQAIGYARIGDKDAAVKSMVTAERFLGARTPEDGEPTWLNFWGSADLSCHQARTFLALGEPAKAERAAAMAMDVCDEAAYPRNHTIYAAVRATALLQDRRVDDAIVAATPVVARVSTLGSRRIVAETQSLVALLRNYRNYGPAASFTTWTNTLLATA